MILIYISIDPIMAKLIGQVQDLRLMPLGVMGVADEDCRMVFRIGHLEAFFQDV
jgi:hypothetical protein